MSPHRLILGDALAARVREAAARAYPDECCGLLEGVATADGWQVLAVHETRNVAQDSRQRFLIDPQAQFDVLRHLRGTQSRLVGCFHSHPDGAPEPSATDEAQAYEAGFVYLIAGGSPAKGFTLAAYVSAAGGFEEVRIASV